MPSMCGRSMKVRRAFARICAEARGWTQRRVRGIHSPRAHLHSEHGAPGLVDELCEELCGHAEALDAGRALEELDGVVDRQRRDVDAAHSAVRAQSRTDGGSESRRLARREQHAAVARAGDEGSEGSEEPQR